ncbi:MAG TPA: O-antigen ligase family protein [Terriglobales bacterium]
MSERVTKVAIPGAILCGCLFALYLALYRSSLLYRLDLVGAFVFLQVVCIALWRFKALYYPLMISAFLWAGLSLPLASQWSTARWFVLAIGAISGLVIYVREQNHHFGILHLTALLAVVAAMVSAVVSSHPEVARLKAGSLLLLFLYTSTGGRLAIISRELRFFSGLLLSCELVVYISSASYLLFHFPIFGNPNSLGAVMGVVVIPLLLWGVLVSQDPMDRRRRAFALVLAIVLLASTYSRASIVGSTIACSVLCVSLRRYRLLLVGIATACFCAVLVWSVAPPPDTDHDSIRSAFLYKGHEEGGALGSRRSVWDQTVISIQQHPWFGTGFGTSATNYDSQIVGKFASNTVTTREHGNSYLAISEWVGLLGVLPFAFLLWLIVFNVARVVVWMRKNGDPFVSAVPIAIVLTAGLVHAAFEDWLFAVGYYLCVFFWILAFAMVDVMPAIRTVPAIAVIPAQPECPRVLCVATSNR